MLLTLGCLLVAGRLTLQGMSFNDSGLRYHAWIDRPLRNAAAFSFVALVASQVTVALLLKTAKARVAILGMVVLGVGSALAIGGRHTWDRGHLRSTMMAIAEGLPRPQAVVLPPTTQAQYLDSIPSLSLFWWLPDDVNACSVVRDYVHTHPGWTLDAPAGCTASDVRGLVQLALYSKTSSLLLVDLSPNAR